jgi:hypothetical protein
MPYPYPCFCVSRSRSGSETEIEVGNEDRGGAGRHPVIAVGRHRSLNRLCKRERVSSAGTSVLAAPPHQRAISLQISPRPASPPLSSPSLPQTCLNPWLDIAYPVKVQAVSTIYNLLPPGESSTSFSPLPERARSTHSFIHIPNTDRPKCLASPIIKTKVSRTRSLALLPLLYNLSNCQPRNYSRIKCNRITASTSREPAWSLPEMSAWTAQKACLSPPHINNSRLGSGPPHLTPPVPG